LGGQWLKFIHHQQKIKLQGILPKVAVGPPISPHQLQELNKTDSILYIVQINVVQNPEPIFPTLPEDLQQVIRQFADVFAPLSELPPSRVGDHKIPLIQRAQPFCLRPFHYNPAQKLRLRVRSEICLIKVGFNLVLVHTHLQSYWCARK
jgi:hypothetical protein